jgi:hypothetical protein
MICTREELKNDVLLMKHMIEVKRQLQQGKLDTLPAEQQDDLLSSPGLARYRLPDLVDSVLEPSDDGERLLICGCSAAFRLTAMTCESYLPWYRAALARAHTNIMFPWRGFVPNRFRDSDLRQG